jgi:hypothetical protein
VNEDSLKNRIEIVTKAAAVGGVLLYTAGFLALSIHHAKFGIPQFSLLRPKIVSTGIAFFVLSALPVLETIGFSGWSQIPQLQEDDSAAGRSRDRVVAFKIWLQTLPVLLIAFLLTGTLLRNWFVGLTIESHYFTWLVLAVIPSAAAVALFQVKETYRSAAVLVYPLVILWIAFCLYRAHDATLVYLTLWLLWWSYLTFEARAVFLRPRRLRTISWIQTLSIAIGTVAMFGGTLYPSIPMALCGGAPIPVTFQFADKQPPVGTDSKMKAWIIDETDAGFYFLQSKDSKKAIFIPRNAVTAVYYGE